MQFFNLHFVLSVMKTWLLILFSLLTLLFSCKPDDEIIITDPGIRLRFSTETILFDTVFTSVGSVTKRLKVYNDHKNAVNIKSISLDPNSPYSIIIDGQETNIALDHFLRGGDSLYILVKVTITPGGIDTVFIEKDSIVFNTNGNFQDVKLVAWGEDAYFFNDSILDCNIVWNNVKPYVIYNSILVDSACSLTIQAGARIYSNVTTFIIVKGTLKVEGTVDDPVIFCGVRLEDKFDNVPGQWGGIFFLGASKNNTIDWAIIKNAFRGVWLGAPDDNDIIPELTISNTIIKNMTDVGILGYTVDIEGYNCLVTNCQNNTVAGLLGGYYDFKHCTFANTSMFSRTDPGVVFSDNLVGFNNEPLTVILINNIIWGNLEDEFLLSIIDTPQTSVGFNSNLIKTTDKLLDNFGNIINNDPLFINQIDYNFQLDALSPAIDSGLYIGITNDLAGNSRDTKPDIGAYEYVPE